MESLDRIIKLVGDSQHMHEEDKMVLRPGYYLAETGKGNFDRSVLLNWGAIFNPWLKVSEDKVKEADEIMRLIYDGLILLDDIVDQAENRNGCPVANIVYGIGPCINAAMHMFMTAGGKVHKFGHPDAPRVFVEGCHNAVRGWGIETSWTSNNYVPTEEEYILMVLKKTGEYMTLPVRLVQLWSDNKIDLNKIIYLLCIYFQIGNDYNNLKSEAYCNERTVGDDITEGKMSFPILHALWKDKPDNKLLNILKIKTHDEKIKKYFIRVMDEYGVFQYTEKVLDKLEMLIREEAAQLGPNSVFDKYFERLRAYSKAKSNTNDVN